MIQDQSHKMLFFFIVFTLFFGGLYLLGRKNSSTLTSWLPLTGGIILFCIAYFSGALAGVIAFPVYFISMYMLRDKTDGGFRKFYETNKIYKSEKSSKAILDVLGERNWSLAEGTLAINSTESIRYLFWQGHTTATVYSGKSTTTSYSYYLAFVFAPSTITKEFKEKALASMDTSHYTFMQKVKYFFVPNTEIPYLVKTALDGSFIIAYNTLVNVETYGRRLEWLKENLNTRQSNGISETIPMRATTLVQPDTHKY